MKKGIFIVIIIILVIAELMTLGMLNESKNELDAQQAKVEKLNSKIEEQEKEIAKYRMRLSTKPDDILTCVKEAYAKQDAKEIVRLYRQFKILPSIDESVQTQIYDYIKTLNRSIEDKELKSVVAEIEKDEAATRKWKSSKEYKAQQEQLGRILSQAAQVANQDSELKRKYGEDAVQYAKSGKVKIGWTKELCEVAWGKPDKKSTYASSNGTTEYWHYDRKGSLNTLMFIDGKLESVSKSDK